MVQPNHPAPAFRASPGSPITVLPSDLLLVTDVNGKIAATRGGAFGPGADWLPWVELGGNVSVALRTPISTLTTGTVTTLFVVNSTGGVATTTMPSLGDAASVAQTTWSEVPMQTVKAVPGSAVTPVANRENGISLFLTDASGEVVSTSSY